jgi:ABC-type dipeptide/oligopeptide/nickel transport system ATPase subunit
MTETRNILIIGRTGNGKSTLANVLTDSEKFNEGSGTISTTKELQKEDFEIEINGEKVQPLKQFSKAVTNRQLVQQLINL